MESDSEFEYGDQVTPNHNPQTFARSSATLVWMYKQTVMLPQPFETYTYISFANVAYNHLRCQLTHRLVFAASQVLHVAHPRATEAVMTTLLLKGLSITPVQTYRDLSHDCMASIQLLLRHKCKQATLRHLCMSHHLQASIMLSHQHHQAPTLPRSSLILTLLKMCKKTNLPVAVDQPHRSMHVLPCHGQRLVTYPATCYDTHLQVDTIQTTLKICL